MIINLIFNRVDSYYDCACGPLICDTKDILWMDGHVLIMPYESLVTGYIKCHILDMTSSPRR